jgi:tRNA A-37 threonylcarbamoyl transferase component Bud32
VSELSIGMGMICFLFMVILLSVIVYLFARRNRRRPVPSRRMDFDPRAFRERLVEDIVRDAAGRTPASYEQVAKPPDPKVPKAVIYGGLFGLIFLVLIVAVLAIAATQSITDPSVAKTAILSIVIGMVVLVLIIGVVIISVAGIIWGAKHPDRPEPSATHDLAENRPQTPLRAAAPLTELRQCPVCEAMIPEDSPEGLCPKCVLGRAMNAPESPILSPKVGETASYNGPSAAPLPGDLATKFLGLEILELLGQGGMGAVYKARQTKLDRTVAVKILPAEWGKDPAFAQRFAREAKALARLSHPHIVAVHDFGETDGLFYLVMEYVDGANLRNILANGGLESHEALAIVPQICDALQYAHEEGIVHRDIKPENILLDSKGRVKIADFGLAKLIDRPRAAFTLTGSQQIMGTLDYMAPEQRLTPQQVDHRADIYSLGVVFYEMLTGELPLGRFAPPSSKVGTDARLDGIVFRALEREPAQRYQRISEVKSDIESITRANALKTPKLSPIRNADDSPDMAAGRFRVTLPAAGLMVTGCLAFLQFLIWVGLQLVAPDLHPWGRLSEVATHTSILLSVVGLAFSAVASAFLVLGGLKMLQLKSYAWAVFGAVWAMMPWSCGAWLLGLPFGIWALLVLRKPEVRAAFASGHRLDFTGGRAGEGYGIVTEIAGGVPFIPIKLGSIWEHRHAGLLRLEEDALVLEYASGVIRSKVKERIIPIKHLRLIRLKHGWFTTSLVLQTASWKPLDSIPTSRQGRLVLWISRKDRVSADRLVRAIHQITSSVEIESPPPPAWKEVGGPAEDVAAAAPPVLAPQPTRPVRRKLRSVFYSVYTTFFSRPKNAEATTNKPLYEHPPGQP